MSWTVFMHVGVAKTGTTFLQRVLWQHREALRKSGTLYPGPGKGSHFLASMDLRGVGFLGHKYPGAEGMWQRLVGEVNAFDGNALLSHETFAGCTPDLIDKVAEDFSSRRLTAVVTCRDLGRQIPAVWQERLKHRHTQPYGEFIDTVLDAWRAGHVEPAGYWAPGELEFWVRHDLMGLTRRWADSLGAEQVVIVTVPPAGADSRVLWDRFAAATGLPDLAYRLGNRLPNPSLGVVKSELLRRLNGRVDAEVPPIDYLTRIKRDLAQHWLAESSAEPLVLPAERYDEVAAIADQTIAHLAHAGHPVVGDLEDLRPQPPRPGSRGPADVPDEELLDSALDALAGLVTRKRAQRPRRVPEDGSRAKGGRAGVSGARGLGARAGALRARALWPGRRSR